MATDHHSPGSWANHDSAMEVVRGLSDLAEKQFLMRAVTAAISRLAAGQAPTSPFDLLFFVRTMRELFAQKENLLRVFAGEDLRWWPEVCSQDH